MALWVKGSTYLAEQLMWPPTQGTLWHLFEAVLMIVTFLGASPTYLYLLTRVCLVSNGLVVVTWH